jgi:hypothetical protein
VVVVAPATAVAGAAATTPANRATPISAPAQFPAKKRTARMASHSRELPPTSVRGKIYSERAAARALRREEFARRADCLLFQALPEEDVIVGQCDPDAGFGHPY